MKRGGSKMGYTEQFGLLSPCYKKGEQPAGFHMGGAKAKPTKKGKKETTKTKKPSTTKKVKKYNSSSKKQRGGSSCGASPSVAEMGVVDTPASLEPTKSELAWDNRMKGGAPNGNVVVNNKKQASIATNTSNLFSTSSSTVENSINNGSLNKIKNKILPTGTISGLAMKLIKTNKNATNPTNEKYSFEIIYKKDDGTNEIKQLVISNVGFGEFLQEYRKISTEVFPPPSKKNNVKVNSTVVKPNGNKNSTVVKPNGNKNSTVVKPNGTITNSTVVKANSNKNSITPSLF